MFLTLKAPITTKADDNLFLIFFFFFNFTFQKKTSLEISCESSAKQTIYMKYQDLFSLKKIKIKKKIIIDCRLLQILPGTLRVKRTS